MLNEQVKTPGVYREDVFLTPSAELRTGVPAFLGYAAPKDQTQVIKEANVPQLLTLWPQFEEHFGSLLPNCYLGPAVRGFFENEGQMCYVVRLDDDAGEVPAVQDALRALAVLDTIDLVCAPDIMRPRPHPSEPFRWLPPDRDAVHAMQVAVLKHCTSPGNRFALLDSLPCADVDTVLQQQQGLRSANGALYYPWVRGLYKPDALYLPDCPGMTSGFIPPCGHVAGVIARTDQRVGVHKAPANVPLQGVSDLEFSLTNAQQDRLNPMGVNCLRAFPGRGLRVWGARTLSLDPAWTYINVQRLVLTVGRWVERNLAGVVFEPNDARLWARVSRELTAYLSRLFQQGALQGRTAQEAFYVKCDAETNPPEVRDAGQLVTKIGLAPALPNEFVVIRITHSTSGVTLAGPTETT